MRHDLFISGFGGQGVLLAGNLLGYAAMAEGKNVSFFPSYGVEKRGGAAMCTVVISDGDTGSPVVGSPSCSILLNQLSFDKYENKVATEGVLILNSSLIESPPNRSDIRTFRIPMNEIAIKIGDARLLNMVAVGAYNASSKAVSETVFESALKKALPERNHRFIPMNLQAIEAGMTAYRELENKL